MADLDNYLCRELKIAVKRNALTWREAWLMQAWLEANLQDEVGFPPELDPLILKLELLEARAAVV